MLNIIILYFALFFIFGLSWIQSKRDILSPSVLLNGSFIVGTSFYMLGVRRLAPEEFAFSTTCLIIVCNLCFLGAEYLTKIIVKGTIKGSKQQYTAFNQGVIYEFVIPNWVFLGTLLLLVLCTVVQLRYEIQYIKGGSLSSVLVAYRNLSNTVGVEGNSFVLFFSRVIYAIIPIYIYYFFFRRFILKKRLKNVVLFVIGMAISLICIFLLTMSRGRIFSIVFQVMAAITICANYSGRLWSKKRQNKGNRLWMKAVIIALFLGIPTFYVGGLLSGKNYSQITALQSVENYFSYGLIRLNHIVINGHTPSDYFGQWSFPGVYSMLNKLGGDFGNYNIFPFYLKYGNTITLYGRWYVDFGVFGTILMSIFVSIFITTIYTKMRYANKTFFAMRNAIIYIFFIPNLLMACYDDWFRNILSLNQILQILIIYVVCKIISKKYFFKYESQIQT